MDWLMRFVGSWNRRVKGFSFWDVKLIQFCGAFLGMAVVKLVPRLLEVSLWAFVAVALLCAARPAYVFWLGGSGQSAGSPS